MAIDLGLHKPALKFTSANVTPDELEERRTILGCYYVASS